MSSKCKNLGERLTWHFLIAQLLRGRPAVLAAARLLRPGLCGQPDAGARADTPLALHLPTSACQHSPRPAPGTSCGLPACSTHAAWRIIGGHAHACLAASHEHELPHCRLQSCRERSSEGFRAHAAHLPGVAARRGRRGQCSGRGGAGRGGACDAGLQRRLRAAGLLHRGPLHAVRTLSQLLLGPA